MKTVRDGVMTDKRSTKEAKATKTDQPRRRRVTFQFEAGPESDVRLAGSFNNWVPTAYRLIRKRGNGTYATTLLLPVGRYEYKLVVNGQWRCDPACADWVPNEHGTRNSVLEVR
jgi:1,4-alpha-glucan branching enzyme